MLITKSKSSPSAAMLQQRSAYIILASAALLVPAIAKAQMEIEVIDLSNGHTIPARISMITEDGPLYLGKTTESGPLKSDVACDGQIIRVAMLYPYWEYNSTEDRQKRCVQGEKTEIFFRPIGLAAAGLTAQSSPKDFAEFPLDASVIDLLNELEKSVSSGDFATISTSAKSVAEELEQVGSKEIAEQYWALSAQSAIAAMSQSEGKDEVQDWLKPSGDVFTITEEGRQVITNYQLKNGLSPLGEIDQNTFARLAESSGNQF